MSQKETILCSAINYKGTIVCGHRHSDCYEVLGKLASNLDTTELPKREDQGFLTSLNRFVDRKEAWKIAKANNQIQFGYNSALDNEDSILISENLY